MGQGQRHGGRPLDFEGLKDNNLYDPWNHAWPYYGGFDCTYCSLKHKGGGATRVVEHLGGIVDFIYKEIEKVVEEIGHEHIVQIVTDNGSNYKKACKTLIEEPKYSHIVWQPCAAHTVNLMLKDIAKSREVDVIVKSAKTICRFMHKHNNLHDNMKKNIGGELIRPNATCFGTVFMFLDSYHLKKDKFREWMVSKDWKECHWRYEPGYVFAEECLPSNVWWNALEWVLGSLRPLYMAMREREREIDKEIDPSALLMDTTMFDETNPIMEWLIEDVEDPIMDGADAASAVFEKIRHLNSSRKASYVGSNGSNKKTKRSDDDENEFVETESEDDDGENEYVDNVIEDDDAASEMRMVYKIS
ncbi:hypothetical protein D1007_17841 [Hordeum vulgare]|nr:hypothetical protein D1007_17841 [Hordeum vulgare]